MEPISQAGTKKKGPVQSKKKIPRKVNKRRPERPKRRTPEQLLDCLERATPALRRVSKTEVQFPEHVRSLCSRLTENLSIDLIPINLKSSINHADPSHLQNIPDAAFYHGTGSPDERPEKLWQYVQAILKEALYCDKRLKDEKAWAGVVQKVWSAIEMPDRRMLELVNIETQQIDPKYLPILPDGSIPNYRADFAMEFSARFSQEVSDTLAQALERNPNLKFSQMVDTHTSKTPLVCVFELKKAGGSSNEAYVQMSLWSAAGLERVRTLNPDAENHDLLPFIGWTIVGHCWKLHISWKDADGKVDTCPIETFNTDNHYDIFKLLKVLKRIKKWLMIDYWSSLQNHILFSVE